MKFTLIILFLVFIATVQAQTDTAKSNLVNDSIYTHVQIEAQFPGGPDMWKRYLNQHLLTPADATSDDTETAIVSFLVDKNRNVVDIKIENADKIDKYFGKKVLAVLSKMPRWMPAIQDGKNVSFRVTKSITSL